MKLNFLAIKKSESKKDFNCQTKERERKDKVIENFCSR